MILTSTRLLSPQLRTVPIDNHAIVIRGSTIVAIGLKDKLIRHYPGHRILYIDNAILLSGLINIHAHLELPHLLNTARTGSFPDWVLHLIKVKRNLISEDYERSVKNNIRSLIQSGITSVGEICTHGISSTLLQQSGLRGLLFQEIIAMNPQKVRNTEMTQHFRSRHSRLIRTGISPHSPFTVSETILRQLVHQKIKNISMHVAESKDETRLLQQKKNRLAELYKFAHWDLDWAPRGASSFEYLNRIGFLSPNLLAVHAVQVTDEDIQLIKKHKVSVAHCPRSNKNLGVGRMPLKKMLDAGITVGLGTDSLASVPTLNMWDEMRYAYKIHKKDGVTAKDIFKMATIGGAKALGLDKESGTLEPGKKADIIAVPLPKKNTGDIYADLIRETESSIMTMVNGKILHQK